MSETLSEKRARAGRLGGLATVAKYGRGHMSEIGRKGAEIFHKLYSYKPVGLSSVAVVRKSDGIIVNFLHAEQAIRLNNARRAHHEEDIPF